MFGQGTGWNVRFWRGVTLFASYVFLASGMGNAFLFGRINGGNVTSLPLGLNFGWQGELNLQYTLDKLFDGEFGMGYPENEAERKRLEASALKDLNQLTKRSWEELVEQLPTDTFTKLLQRKIVMNAIITNGTNEEFIRLLKEKIGKK